MSVPGRRCVRSAARRRSGRRPRAPWRSASHRWNPTPGGRGNRWRGGGWGSCGGVWGQEPLWTSPGIRAGGSVRQGGRKRPAGALPRPLSRTGPSVGRIPPVSAASKALNSRAVQGAGAADGVNTSFTMGIRDSLRLSGPFAAIPAFHRCRPPGDKSSIPLRIRPCGVGRQDSCPPFAPPYFPPLIS